MVAVLLPGLTLAVQETLEGEGSVPVVPSEVLTAIRPSTGLLAGLQGKGICDCDLIVRPAGLTGLCSLLDNFSNSTSLCRLQSVLLSRPADRGSLLVTKHGWLGIIKIFVRGDKH